LKSVGIGAAICAGVGILTTSTVWIRLFTSKDKEDRDPDFRKFFVLFSFLSIFYNLVLTVLAGLLITGYYISWWFLLIFSLLPLAFTSWLGTQWLNPKYGNSLGAATGIGNVGMGMPLMLLLPIWGPVALWFAR
jgi:hypothetical protein